MQKDKTGSWFAHKSQTPPRKTFEKAGIGSFYESLFPGKTTKQPQKKIQYYKFGE